MKFKEWLNKGEGGSWYEPYVTNLDSIHIFIFTLIGCLIIILGCIIYLSN